MLEANYHHSSLKTQRQPRCFWQSSAPRYSSHCQASHTATPYEWSRRVAQRCPGSCCVLGNSGRHWNIKKWNIHQSTISNNDISIEVQQYFQWTSKSRVKPHRPPTLCQPISLQWCFYHWKRCDTLARFFCLWKEWVGVFRPRWSETVFVK